MKFFDKILDENGGIVRGGKGHIMQCIEELADEFYINDNLRALLLDPSHKCYNIISASEREQFIFLLFKHLCLGGKWCQNEDVINPYIDLTKELYKDIISVERTTGEHAIAVRSLVLKVVAYGSDGEAIFPKNPHNIQNVAYLIIDPFKRQVIVLVHQFGGTLNL
ncbi:hypothetical protein AAG570_010346 [Ranatra chinensis]|uniref:Cilia- and flagella-associated protein 300 n=1 Tax=Ranatra chinensis TaxID=642074 RepID=A0ABD0YMA1_9HEMI